MKNLKRVSGFTLAILMAVSVLFMGTVEMNADTGTVYEPYYDVETGKILGAPEVGTVLNPEDIITGNKLVGNVDIDVNVHLLKEEITENAYGYNIYDITHAEQITVSELETYFYTSASSYTVAKVEISELGEKKTIEISVYSNDPFEKIEDVVIELDWSKFEAEIGGLLDTGNFKEGFVKNEKFTSKVGFLLGEIIVVSSDGTEESYYGGDEVIINETDSYKINAVFMLKDGYYVEVGDDVVVNDETVNGTPEPYTGQSHYWTTRIVVPIDFGTGAEMVERVENAKTSVMPPTSGEDEKDPVEESNDYSAKMENVDAVVDKIVLTDEEKTAIANGEELVVVLGFKEVGKTATTEEQKAIAKELGDKKVGAFLEIDLTKKIGTREEKVSETTGAVAITFELPAELKNTDTKVNRTYSIVRYHDGKVDILDTKYNAENGTITFETDKFSTYAVVYEDVEKVPATGDTTSVVMYVMLFVMGTGFVLTARKQNRI